jgi:hypothetical protein
VTVDDRPLAEGSVVFWPDSAKGNQGKEPATGGIYGAGNYTLYTDGRQGMQKGASPGWYKVVVFPYALSASARAPKRAPEEIPGSPVDARYMDVDTTTLFVEVTESPSEGAYHLRLTR